MVTQRSPGNLPGLPALTAELALVAPTSRDPIGLILPDHHLLPPGRDGPRLAGGSGHDFLLGGWSVADLLMIRRSPPGSPGGFGLRWIRRYR